MLRKFRCADFGPNLQGGELPPLRGSAWGTSPFPPPQLYAYVYGYGWAMDVYCVHWVQNAQIRPVRFFSNFKSCGNFAVPTLDQIFRGGTSPPERLSLGNFPLPPPPVVRLCLWIWMGYGCILRPLGAKRANKASTIFF